MIRKEGICREQKKTIRTPPLPSFPSHTQVDLEIWKRKDTTYTHTHTHTYIYIYIYIYGDEYTCTTNLYITLLLTNKTASPKNSPFFRRNFSFPCSSHICTSPLKIKYLQYPIMYQSVKICTVRRYTLLNVLFLMYGWLLIYIYIYMYMCVCVFLLFNTWLWRKERKEWSIDKIVQSQ